MPLRSTELSAKMTVRKSTEELRRAVLQLCSSPTPSAAERFCRASRSTWSIFLDAASSQDLEVDAIERHGVALRGLLRDGLASLGHLIRKSGDASLKHYRENIERRERCLSLLVEHGVDAVEVEIRRLAESSAQRR